MSTDTPLIIQTTPEQRQNAFMLAMGFPLIIQNGKDMAEKHNASGILESVLSSMASVGITEEKLIELIQAMATAEDLRITVDGDLIFRVVPE